MTHCKSFSFGIILFACLLFSAFVGFTATVQTPMVEDLNGGTYDIYNVNELYAADIIAEGPRADVRAYGAVGDGSTDDTTEIQSAIDNNSCIMIPKGYTFVVSGLDVSSDTILFGGGVLKLKSGSTDPLISATGDNIVIRDLELDGNDVGTALSGIYCDNCDSIKILNCITHDFTNPGIHLESSTNVIVTGNESYENIHPSSSFGDGIYLGGCSNAIVTDNICRDNKRIGICCSNDGSDNSDYFIIANNVLEGHTGCSAYSAGIWVELNGERQSRAVIANNICRDNYNGIYSTDPSKGMSICGNTIEGQPADPYYVGTGILSRGGIVENNIVKCQNKGISIDTIVPVIVNGNYLRDIHDRGILVKSSSDEDAENIVNLSNNQVIDANYGIYVAYDDQDFQKVTITGNTTRRKAGGNKGLYISSGYQILSGVIANNNFLESSYPIDCQGNAKVLFTNNIGASVKTVTANTTLSFQECLLVNASGGTRTITLSDPVDGRVVTIKKIDSSANAITIQGYSGENIDGAGTATLSSQWSTVTLYSDGTDWYKR